LAQVLSRIAAAAQAWQQGSGQQPAGKAQASAGNPQAVTKAEYASQGIVRDPVTGFYTNPALGGLRVGAPSDDPYPPGQSPADYEGVTGQHWEGNRVVNNNPYEITAEQLRYYYDNTTHTVPGQRIFEPGPGGGVTQVTPDITRTLSEWQNQDSYSQYDTTPQIGKDGYTIADFVDDMKTDRRLGEIQDAEVRKIIGRRQDPQIAINRDNARNERLKRGQAGYTDDVGRSRRRRTLAALGTRKGGAGSGVLGGGGQPSQAVRPGRTPIASVLG